MIYLDFVREVSGLVQEIRKIDEFLYKIKDQRQRALSDAEEEFSRKQSEIQGNYQHSLKGNETDYKKKKDGLSVTRKELEKCLASLGNVKRTAGGREYDSERLSELMVQLDEVSFLSSLKKRFGILGYQSDRKSKRESYEIIQAGLNQMKKKTSCYKPFMKTVIALMLRKPHPWRAMLLLVRIKKTGLKMSIGHRCRSGKEGEEAFGTVAG